MDLQLRGKKALVTGASQGIGRETAVVLAEEGCSLLLASRNAERLEEAAHAIRAAHGVPVETVAADLSVEAGRQRVVAAAGQLDLLVNNAGAIPSGSLQEIDNETWQRAWELKVFGYISLSRSLYAGLKARSGVIVNVIGSAGEAFPPDYIAGTTGNAALMAFTRALGKEAARDGMRVVGINPGPVSTPRREHKSRARAEREFGDAGRWREYDAALPYGRAALAREIAGAVAFLASPRSGYTNGTILTINGGA
ncbi:short-chain dehydrogenase/reductase [Arthrobacter mobilis]|uniref:SDR family NAD(P)-dependent oxidoreductase n=1 Tax=Arthrobacter mobilis TaxID=2724944 RepID=A0A7X6HCA0_9MICC|nr:short-chain dehydrogenase/reductase [Arthrobacter mobilis]NKX54462.1 SDR family NAD(P)-dependent oxidoreductase [Arthrobacter mobilis]